MLPPSSDPPVVAEPVTAARRRAQALADGGASLQQVLAFLASTAETLSPVPAHSSILLIDRSGLLRNGASPNLPADYLDAIDRLRPDPGVGTCAAAAATGQIVMTRSFMTDRAWAELRHLPLALGYRSAWSMPIKSDDGTVVGTFGTYFTSERLPSDAEVAVVDDLAREAARVIARARERAGGEPASEELP